MKTLCMPLIFGEVLFDCFPDGHRVLGGAPFNVAWNLQAFGLHPVVVSSVGDDDAGREIREKMTSWGLNTECLQTDPSHPTGRVRVELNRGEPHFTILPDQAYDHIAPPGGGLQHAPSFLYHGSLALRHDVSRSTLFLLKHKYQCPVFVDVNLRSPWWDADSVHEMMRDATWLKLNEVELDSLFPGQDNLEKRCGEILERFNLEAIFVTLGKSGAVALNHKNNFCSVAPYESTTVVDTVGAGDGFASVLLLGLMEGWLLDATLQRAQEFASGVVGQRGAITDNTKFYASFCNRWQRR